MPICRVLFVGKEIISFCPHLIVLIRKEMAYGRGAGGEWTGG